MSKFYITTAIPYVNARPHIGHALEFVQADTIARFHRLKGEETLLLSGGDENALKNVQAAEAEKTPVQEFIDRNSKLFEELAKKLNVQFDVFQKGSNNDHHKSSQKLWELCFKNGDIYKKTYEGLYCVGCETFYETSELNENGECFEHPGKKLDKVSEENYFFKLSKYEKQILELLEKAGLKIIPETRKNEAVAFVKQGLKDISISRSNARAKNWGVSVPGDPSQKIYVWFDALNIYQSGLGFGTDEENYKKWWPADVHVIGKGILRFHAVYWPAFLLSADLPLPKSIFVHGYLTVNGQKMSKTLGNVVDPISLIEKHGADALRFYLLREIPTTSDGDFSEDRFREVYNSDLANGLGNLVSRVAKLCETEGFSLKETGRQIIDTQGFDETFYEFRLNDAVALVWEKISSLDRYIESERPWDLIKKKDQRIKAVLEHLTDGLLEIAIFLKPFLPETAEKIEKQFTKELIKLESPLFPRI